MCLQNVFLVVVHMIRCVFVLVSYRNFVMQVKVLKENTENFIKSKNSYQKLLDKCVVCTCGIVHACVHDCMCDL